VGATKPNHPNDRRGGSIYGHQNQTDLNYRCGAVLGKQNQAYIEDWQGDRFYTHETKPHKVTYTLTVSVTIKPPKKKKNSEPKTDREAGSLSIKTELSSLTHGGKFNVLVPNQAYFFP
jgi:hypothetical protein